MRCAMTAIPDALNRFVRSAIPNCVSVLGVSDIDTIRIAGQTDGSHLRASHLRPSRLLVTPGAHFWRPSEISINLTSPALLRMTVISMNFDMQFKARDRCSD
jgi:hypothetical protein